MSDWQDDRWKDSYDAWKLASPDDDYDPREDCNHEEAEIDWEGRARCDYCGANWWASAEEIEAQRLARADYAQWERQQRRIAFLKQWFLEPTFALRWRIHEWLCRRWPWRKARVISDHDEIPF